LGPGNNTSVDPIRITLLLAILLATRTTAADLQYTTSWVGNSFSGRTQWAPQDIDDLYVEPDGTLFTNIPWEEGGANVQQYKDGKFVRSAFHTHGWGYEGGQAVAANSKYVFIAQTVENEGGGLKGNSWPAKGLNWSGVSRRLRSDISKAAPFEGGRGKEGDVLHGCFLPVAEAPEQAFRRGGHGAIRGLSATGECLFVSSPLDDSVKVFDAETLKPIRSWKVQRPDKICLDRAAHLWALQRPDAGGHWKALCFSQNGELLGPTIDFDAATQPSALCGDSRGRLLVTDDGPDQQIKIYEGLDQSPRLAGTFGVKGGILAGPVPGRFGDGRFNAPKGIGVDGAGNTYVASSGSVDGGSTVLECYAPDGRCLWRIMGLTFVDLAALDARSDTELYTKEEHFTLDYARDAGQEWSYRGYTVNRFKYPDDPRLHLEPTHVWVRRIDGQKVLFVTDMTGDFLHAYRFDEQRDGEVAIPCALFSRRHVQRPDSYPPNQPDKGEWLWRDRNGNGAIDPDEFQTNGGTDAGGPYEPDEQGSIWSVGGDGIRRIPIQGLGPYGVPSWDYAKARLWPRPDEFDQVRRVHYLPAQDVMLLGGNRGKDHNQHWKPMGPVLCCYDHWSTDQRRLRWQVLLPYETGAHGHESAEPISFDVAGDYLFAAYTRGLKEQGIKYAFVRVYDLADGSLVGNLVPERELGEVGLLDLIESVSAARRPNGEYVVLLEDDAKAKVVMFRWRP
jgi:hypothetical protein